MAHSVATSTISSRKKCSILCYHFGRSGKQTIFIIDPYANQQLSTFYIILAQLMSQHRLLFLTLLNVVTVKPDLKTEYEFSAFVV